MIAMEGYNFENIICKSEEMKSIINNCKKVANSPSTILIEGESGTGKEVLAKAIHNYSNRKNNKFVAINCGAIPKNLIESELFGYEEGAFTGSRKGGSIGKIELANNGTLFLDEIGDMPFDMQVKLLRVLQEEKVIRIGGNKEIPVNMRVIAATNKNLKEEVKRGKFRDDLYYRLCVIPVVIPPLRDRKEDILELIDYFLVDKSKKLNKPFRKLDKELLEKLLSYSWPGNVRELENIIENIVNLDGKMSIELLNEEERMEYCKRDKCRKYLLYKRMNEFNLKKVEESTIKKALDYYNYNLTRAAKSLGISRNTLYLKIKKYNIDIENSV